MKKLRKGDDVIIIAGKDKGKRGTIISVKEAVFGPPFLFAQNPS